VILVESGHTYERVEIDKWLAIPKKDDSGESYTTDPMTGARLQDVPVLAPNRTLKASIAEHMAANSVP